MREDWLEKRKQGIGGSDAPAVCGVSPWKSPYQVWVEKTGNADEHPVEETEPMYWGKALEPAIRQRYADQTGRTVIVPKDILVHPKHDWMIGSLDGLATDRVLEIKTSRTLQGWGEPGSDEIPDFYRIQVEHYMMITKLTLTDVAALIGGSDFRIYTVEADPVLQELILEREAQFWELVKKGTPPEPTAFSDIKSRYRISKAVPIQATDLVIVAIEQLKKVKELTAEEEKYKAIIMGHMKDADTLMDEDKILATWKTAKASQRLDQKFLQEKYPDIYKECLKEADPIRRLLIK